MPYVTTAWGTQVWVEPKSRGRKTTKGTIDIRSLKHGESTLILGSYSSAYQRCKTAIKGVDDPPIFTIDVISQYQVRVTAFDRDGRVGITCNRDLANQRSGA